MNESDQRLLTLFTNALDRPAGEARAAFVAEVCGDDASLRQRLDALLAAHERLDGFLETPETQNFPATPPVADTTDRTTFVAGTVLAGRYKLLEEIGDGGMGTVWMAEQSEPVRRRVALKLIKPGMDSKHVLARFNAERQALAMMDHPNIAKVHDAGTTAEGRPFFVMELVKGVPITNYCDEHKLTPHQRLELFVPVCHAIQHAHQKGIIHRDIKPSNVLVAMYDDRPVPKVIDFGVAKATGIQLTEQTLNTGFGAVVGTVEYMSPEQAGFNQLDIDTRSDIYSLGVLLYELLTGTTPLTRKRAKEAALLEVLRLVREEEPPKPSTRLSTTDELPSIAAVRGMEPARLSKLVRGDLDWIVMKALEKDRSRRYETANGFAADVQRYIGGEAVQAVPPSTGYRLRKFARRNRSTLAVGTLLLTVIGLGALTSTLEAVRARRAEKRAEDGWVSEMAARSEADVARGQAIANLKKAREAVDRMLSRVGEYEIARLVPHLVKFQRKLLEDALEFNKGFLEVDQKDPDLKLEAAKAHLRISRMYQFFNENEAGEKAADASIGILTSLAEEFPNDLRFQVELVRAYIDLGYALKREPSQLRRHEETRLRAVALAENLVIQKPKEREFQVLRIESHCCLGETLLWFNKAPEAEPELHLAFKLAQELDDWYFIGRCAQFLGESSRSQNRLDAAEHYYGIALDNLRKSGLDTNVAGIRNVGQIRISLADVLARRGRSEDAEAQLTLALELFAGLSRDYPDSIYLFECAALCAGRLGEMLKDRKQFDGARSAFRRALEAHFRIVSASPAVGDRHEALWRCFLSLDAILVELMSVTERKKLKQDVTTFYQTLMNKAPSENVQQAMRRINFEK